MKKPGEKGSEVIKSECVPDLVVEKPHLFILGDDQAGKTALAKNLFSVLRVKGDIPVYLDMAKQKLSIANCARDIELAFVECYDRDSLEKYRQTDRARRVLILDNLHRGKIPPRDKAELFNAIKQHCYRVVILAHDIALSLYDLTISAADDSEFLFYTILPFSFKQQNKLIEKWLLLGQDSSADTCSFVANLERLRKVMDTIFGKNYVPAYPPYMLSILQANESSTELDLKANTHGYFYELFIKQLIARNVSSAVAMNILTAYLSHLAHSMHLSGKQEITEAEMRKLHSKLQIEYEVLKSFSDQVEQLLRMQLLRRSNDVLKFKQPYIFYYFLALYLHNHLDEPTIQALISRMVSELFIEQNASTLLFLAHLTKDRRILDSLLAICDSQFSNAIPALLQDDVKFVSDLDADAKRLEIRDQSLSESRKEGLEILDQERENELNYEENNKTELESRDTLLGRLNGAIKTIQILGQYLKNFPANLGRAEKDQIIASCSSLAGRVLGEFLNLIFQNQAQALSDFACLIGKQKPGLSNDKLRARAANAILTMTEWASLGMIWRLAQSLGSSELMTTFDRYFGEQEGYFLKLTHLALKLDHNEAFPEAMVTELADGMKTNQFAFKLLQQFVRRRLLLFPADFKLKQKLSSQLSLDYKLAQVPRPEQRLIQ